MTTRNVILAVAGAALALQLGYAAAQPAKPGRDRACAEDAKKFCSNVHPGGGRMYQCLTSHSAELAPACRDQLSAAKAAWDKFMRACKGDIEKACKTIPPGQGRVLSCLKGREDQLSPECRAEFSRARSDATLNK